MRLAARSTASHRPSERRLPGGARARAAGAWLSGGIVRCRRLWQNRFRPPVGTGRAPPGAREQRIRVVPHPARTRARARRSGHPCRAGSREMGDESLPVSMVPQKVRAWKQRGPLGLVAAGLILAACQAPSPPAAAPPPAASAVPSAPSAPRADSAAAPAAAAPTVPAAQPATQELVRVGMLSSISDAPFLIGRERGYFREEGLDLELTQFDSAQQMIAPMGAGQLDVGGGAPGAGLIN